MFHLGELVQNDARGEGDQVSMQLGFDLLVVVVPLLAADRLQS